MAKVDKIDRLERTREKADLATLWDGDDMPMKGDRVQMVKSVLKDKALDADGNPHVGVVTSKTTSGMLVVRFDQNVAPNRKHVIMHPVEVEIVEAVERPKREETKSTATEQPKAEDDNSSEDGKARREVRPDPKQRKQTAKA